MSKFHIKALIDSLRHADLSWLPRQERTCDIMDMALNAYFLRLTKRLAAIDDKATRNQVKLYQRIIGVQQGYIRHLKDVRFL